MSFDYSGLNRDVPSGYRVIRAGESFHIKHRASGRDYIIDHKMGEHYLYASSKIRPTDVPEFIMRSDNLRQILLCLGWLKLPTRR